MTALRAFQHGKKVGVVARTRSHAPFAADVIPMIEQDPANDGQTLPAPTSPTAPSLTTPDGTRLVAGLTWEIASGPETPVVRPDAPLVLRLPERRAQLALTARTARTDSAASSLLLAMGDALTRIAPDAKGTWAFLVAFPVELRDPESDFDGDPLLWLALADLGAPDADAADTPAATLPRPGPEQLFSDPDAALAALHKHLATTEIAGVGVSWLPEEGSHRGRILQGLAHIAPTLPLEDVDLHTLSDNPGVELPRFVPPRRVPARVLGGLGGGVALLLAGVFVGVPMLREAFRAPPPPPPEMVSVRIEDGAFARACTTALDAWWPRRVGWQLDNAGCALAGHLPATPDLPVMEIPARPIQPMVIWQHLVPEAGRNTVLARDAAEQVVERWPHEARLDPDGLTLWKTAALPLVPVEGDETRERTPSLDLAGIQTRLAAFWADTPGAVSRSDNGASSFTIRTTRPPAAVFERAARVPGIAPVRLIQSGSTGGGGNTLVLTPVTPRNVPVTMIGDNAIPSQGKGEQ